MHSVTNFLFPGCFEGTKVLLRRVHTKGGVISESFSIWLKSTKIGAKFLSWALYTWKKMLRSDLAYCFWGLSQIEKLSKIKQPLILPNQSILWGICRITQLPKQQNNSFILFLRCIALNSKLIWCLHDSLHDSLHYEHFFTKVVNISLFGFRRHP